MKKILLLLTLALCAPMTFAQNVPSYVPTDGLVGYWPFNGNANDESGNGYNGLITGATLTTDRFGQVNNAFAFNGKTVPGTNNTLVQRDEVIQIPGFTYNFGIGFSVSFWSTDDGGIQRRTDNNIDFAVGISGIHLGSIGMVGVSNIPDGLWHHYSYTYDGSSIKQYKDGNLISTSNGSGSMSNNTTEMQFGRYIYHGGLTHYFYLNGLLDDIGFWNHALTQEEIANLYQGCALSITTQPTNQTTNISNNAQFNVESSDPDATYQWQTDLGVGFQNISNAGQYSGATNNTLTIANTTLSNNNQLFRCIIAKASCTETSSVATLNVNEAIPSNVPSDGLVGYWPFNGNANDESGNGNNGTPINGVLLTTDRFNNSNCAYSFDGIDDRIFVNNSIFNNGSDFTFSGWYYLNNLPNSNNGNNSHILLNTSPHNGLGFAMNWGSSNKYSISVGNGSPSTSWNTLFNANSNQDITTNSWKLLTLIKSSTTYYLYVNGILDQTWVASNLVESYQYKLYFGGCDPLNSNEVLDGKLDDIAIYNRALTQEEITQLYYTDNTCQSLVINTGVLSFNPPTYNNTVTIYPNPANDHITIDCGNLANVSGWSIKIFNTLGQEVFSGSMNTQQYVVPLNTWSGQGVYFVKIYDASNQLMNTKKIILQ